MRSDLGERETVAAGAVSAGSDSIPADDPATASTLIAACESGWRDIQNHHPELPDVVMVLGTGVERGRLVKLGHWWGGQWVADGQTRGEVLLAGEALHLEPPRVFEVLLHEAAHGINAARGVKDTSRGGRYHNKRFADTARQVLLRVRAMPPYGLAATDLTPAALDRYGPTIEGLGDAMRIARQLRAGLRIGADGSEIEGTLEGGKTGGKDKGDGQPKAGARAAACGCGRKMRMAPSTLAAGPVVCGLCGTEFTNGAERSPGQSERTGADRDPAEPERTPDPDQNTSGEHVRISAGDRDPTDASFRNPTESSSQTERDIDRVSSDAGGHRPDETNERDDVIDRSFVERRKAAVASEPDPDLPSDGDVARVLDHQRARLRAVSRTPPDRTADLPRPADERRGRLERFLRESLAVTLGSSLVNSAAATAAEAGDLLIADRVAADHDALRNWYERFGTYDEAPMPATTAADAARRERLARTILKADGTLDGPAVMTPDGKEFQAGDRVQPTLDHGDLPAGTLGTIERVDLGTGTVDIDFATWGRLQATLTDSLARDLRHDYTEIRTPDLEPAGVEL